MTPEAFISKWSQATTRERAASQEHFIDLCRLLEERTPNEADPEGSWYAFEKGTQKTGAGRGWADVWKRGCFGWEYKGKGRDLTKALQQLQLYALALESPPLLIVSDIETIEIHTAFQNAVQEVHTIRLADLATPEARQKLRWVFSEPERLRPSKTRLQITEEAAGKFASLAFELRKDGHDPHSVAHFLNKMLFCMFAEDAGLLPHNLFTKAVERGVEHPEHVDAVLKGLFRAMQSGGTFGSDFIEWFNGGLFDNNETLALSLAQIRTLRDLAHMDWSQMEPAIFGTLFERGLDPSKRSQLGAHYTDPGSIMRLVNPTIVEPLLSEWEKIKAALASQMERFESVKTKQAREKILRSAQNELQVFLERLKQFRVLDPACGSGNFLYLALQALKDIEHRVILEAEALGLQRSFPSVGPECVHGIEINSYAAELARVTVWIGEIQWMLTHGYSLSKNPILKPLDTIEERDALVNLDGTEATWPRADAIIGNPPFLGNKKHLRELGDEYVAKLRAAFEGRVPAGADLVTYWFEKARYEVERGQSRYMGLVGTNSIRGGINRVVLARIVDSISLFEAWSDEPWVNEGASVRVSLVCAADSSHARGPRRLDGKQVEAIYSDLSEGKSNIKLDLTQRRPLPENKGVSFQGVKFVGAFAVPADVARRWLETGGNPNGRPNSDVIRRWVNGDEFSKKRPQDAWLIDFGTAMPLQEAEMYELPFQYVVENIQKQRSKNREGRAAEKWWLHQRARPRMRQALDGLSRYIATPEVAKHRVFQFVSPVDVLPSGSVYAFARSDAVTLGILQSKFHLLWALRQGTTLEDRPRYTATTTFETFPFPEGLTPDMPADAYTNPHSKAIELACLELLHLRNSWLNPDDWVDYIAEVVPGYPDRMVPNAEYAAHLKKRTFTALYNSNPRWLQSAHGKLDEAVAAAYGWPANLTDEEVLQRLLELNLERSSLDGS